MKSKRHDDMTIKELEEVMVHFELIESWMKAVRGRVLTELMRGRKSKLWKLVQGRSTRSWADEQRVMKLLAQLKFPQDTYAPRSLVGVATVEKLCIKRKLAHRVKGKVVLPAVLSKHIKRSEPPLHVARIDDPRSAVQRGQEFKGK